MKEFFVHDVQGKLIGTISLMEETVQSIGAIHPRMNLGYSWNENEPEHILSFMLIMEPVVPNSLDDVTYKHINTTNNQCILCGATESDNWWKCCPNHTTEQGSDVVCQRCKDEKHPVCGAVRAGGWGVQYKCTFNKDHDTPHSWMVGF